MNSKETRRNRKRERRWGAARIAVVATTTAFSASNRAMEISAFSSTILSSRNIESSTARVLQRLEMVAAVSPIELETTIENAATTTTIQKDITMEDVVASVALEMEERREHYRQWQEEFQQSHHSKSPFDWFEARDKARIMES